MDAPAEVDLAVAELHETMHQAPECFGLPRSRWWLDGLRQAVPWLKPLSLPGVWQLLDRFDLAYKRGRRYVHSPDPDYPLKAARLRSIWQQVQADPTHLVLLYQDELTYYRCPTVGYDYALRDADGPRAAQGTGYNTSRRIAGCLDASTGRLITWQRSAFDHQTTPRAICERWKRAIRVRSAFTSRWTIGRFTSSPMWSLPCSPARSPWCSCQPMRLG